MRSLAGGKTVRARTPSSQKPTNEEVIERVREVADIVDRMADYLMIACVCGVRIKLPPEWKRASISCPRCGVEHDVPHAESGPAAAKEFGEENESEPGAAREEERRAAEKGTPPEDRAESMQFQRKGSGWEAFKCSCGGAVQLSPSFRAHSARCGRCRRSYKILDPEPEPEKAVANA